MHGFRFGVQLSTAASVEEWANTAQRAEALGYDVFCIPDHVGPQLSPFAALAAAASVTKTISLGTLVLDNDFRHPLLMAHEAATLQLLSGGRLELGLGAGWLGRDYERLGIPFDEPRLRVDRLSEAIQIVERYFAGETFSFEGRHYSVQGAEPLRLPPGMSRPPLLIGAGGPRMLSLAARHADAASVFMTASRDGSGFEIDEASPEAFRSKTEGLRAASSGTPVEVNVLIQWLRIDDTRTSQSGEDLPPFELVGTVDEIVDGLQRRRDDYGISYVTIRREHLESFAPVVERLSGA